MILQRKRILIKKAQSNKCKRDTTLMNLIKSPSLMISAAGISNKIILSSDPIELCDRLKRQPQEKQAENNCKLINEKINAIVDKLLEYKCISTKQHEQVLIKGNHIHTKKK